MNSRLWQLSRQRTDYEHRYCMQCGLKSLCACPLVPLFCSDAGFLSIMATKLPKNGNKLLPETATKSPFPATLLPFRATIFPFSATIASATICCRFGRCSRRKRQQTIMLPFRATMLPFSATLLLVWTGLKDGWINFNGLRKMRERLAYCLLRQLKFDSFGCGIHVCTADICC